jgi:threonine dehydrogenase-like Zn-dependent dehydrogenase
MCGPSLAHERAGGPTVGQAHHRSSTVKAVTWHGKRDVRVDEVPDPRIEEPTDAIVRITSSAICGSDLHLYEVLTMFMQEGDIIGHEPMGIVEEVGPEVSHIAPGDRVVIPFNISCGSCFMCDRQLYAQCETTQNVDHGRGASLFGYTELYGRVPGAQAEYLRVPHADFGPIKVPEGPDDTRFLYLSDIIPTAWQGVRWADVGPGDTLAVFGLGPVGQFATRIAHHLGVEDVIGIDLVDERLEMARRHETTVLDVREIDDVPEALAELTDGRGPDGVLDAVGMEAHGGVATKAMQQVASVMPDGAVQPVMEKAGVDRMSALLDVIGSVRRAGTISLSGVYGGQADPLPMLDLFDKGVQIRMGQCHVKRWIDEIMPAVTDDADPLGTQDLMTHQVGLESAPEAYELFQKKQDDCIKVVLTP